MYFHFEQISEADNLPKCICKACFAQVMVVKEFFENIINADKVLKHKHEQQKQEKESRIKMISEKLAGLPISVKKVPVKQPVTITQNLLIDKNGMISQDISHVLQKLKGVTVKKTKVSIGGSDSVVPSVQSEVIPEVISVPPRRTTRNKQGVMYTEELKPSTAKEDDSDEEYKPPTSTTPRSTPKKKKLSSSSNGKSPSVKPIIKMVLNTGPAYVCVTCKSRFESFEKLKDHMLQSQKCKYANVTCQVCNKVCQNRKALYAHSLTHKEKVLYTCEICSKSFANRFNLENHKVSAHAIQVEENGSIFRCRLCEKQFSSRALLFTHMKDHQKDKIERLCETCGKSFLSMDALKAHTRTHSKQPGTFACNVDGCKKVFRSNVQLIQHSHVHTGIKSFACQKCEKTYAKKSSLAIHEKIHSNNNGAVTFKCRHCGISYLSSVKLKEHVKNMHPNRETTPSPEMNQNESGVLLVPAQEIEEALTIEERVIIQPTTGNPSSYTLSFQNF